TALRSRRAVGRSRAPPAPAPLRVPGLLDAPGPRPRLVPRVMPRGAGDSEAGAALLQRLTYS
ncbi:hypothetical protein ACWGIQ_34740, partial [Streptomyces sp. NPDC054845]